MSEEDSSLCFLVPEDVPQRAFFAKDYITLYKRQVNELIKRMEHLVEEVENFETESDSSLEWNGVQLATLTRDTVWQNLCALQDCDVVLNDTVDHFKQKIRESMELVANNPAQFSTEHTDSTLSVRQSMTNSEYSSSDSRDETDDDEVSDTFRDVIPVTKKKEALALNDDVTARVKKAFGANEEEFERFKTHAFEFGTGKETAEGFYEYLQQYIVPEELGPIVLDFARLLPQAALRIPLLKVHYAFLEKYHMQLSNGEGRHKSYSTVNRAPVVDDYDSDDDNIDELPTTLRLSPINHLVFIIHGIGQHIDFKEGELKSWNGETGLDGGNHAFRDLYRTMLETMFRDIPVALEMQSIEWHEDLHEPTGLDSVFDLICPEGSTGIREFNKETLMDVLYYLSPRYGQLVVDAVTQQLNQKYHVFMEEHPDWDGKVSIFAHSLGSVITYDLLTHNAGEQSPNGVVFPGIEFEVENFFGAGSPVPVFILSRGDLNIQDGNFTPGIKMPNCKRYFNIFHPIDPIAYRVEPLIQQEMHDKPPVQLIQAHAVRHLNFGKIQEMWESMTAPVHGFPYRLDYVMKRRKREQGMMEIAFAAASHSAYWMSEDVVLFTIMQICQPVVEKLHRYMMARKPLPILMRNIVELTPHTKVLMSANASIRDRCTGFTHDRVVLMEKERLFILPRVHEVACRRKWRIRLNQSAKATYGDDSFMLKIVSTEQSIPPLSGSVSPARPPTPASGYTMTYLLKAPTTRVRDEWLNLINQTIARNSYGLADGTPYSSREQFDMAELPHGLCMDYFGAQKAGYLQEKALKGWYEGWNNRWIVLQDGYISCYESSPRLEFSSQFKIRKARIFCYETGYLFRVVSRRGTSIEMRVKDQHSFNLWLDVFGEVPSAEVTRHKDLIENSPSAVLMMSESSEISGSGKGEWLHTKIEGYKLALDEKDVQYATFIIQVKSSSSGSSFVQRRYSEFAKLHRELRKVIPHEQVPSLPGTRMWNKFDPVYLKEKTVALHGYLTEICKRCANTRAQPILLEFLELAPQSETPNGNGA
ncbi:Phospholipase, partial [Globisporangium splendens]